MLSSRCVQCSHSRRCFPDARSSAIDLFTTFCGSQLETVTHQPHKRRLVLQHTCEPAANTTPESAWRWLVILDPEKPRLPLTNGINAGFQLLWLEAITEGKVFFCSFQDLSLRLNSCSGSRSHLRCSWLEETASSGRREETESTSLILSCTCSSHLGAVILTAAQTCESGSSPGCCCVFFTFSRIPSPGPPRGAELFTLSQPRGLKKQAIWNWWWWIVRIVERQQPHRRWSKKNEGCGSR